MSLPEMLDLRGKTALVTGGRVNLGFSTALRLLRCGAKVIVSSRYPHDTLVRYQTQPDSDSWIKNRLRVVGADFRTARDAFALAAEVKNILVTWSTGDSASPLLDILINNAAQTLTDGEAKETTAVKRESNLHLSLPAHPALPETSYTPRIGGGAPEGFLEGRTQQALQSANTSTSVIQPVPEKSSWVQDMSEIPYADIITAQAVNAFVPLILIRELLPVMSHGEIREQQSGHIINVSSREGIFEASRNHSAKKGTHVHTNMSKAALNMITETEAGPAWRSHGVAMNTVDPGYMSASPEMEDLYGGVRPLSWEDGAGRVLWPVAMAFGEEKTVIWGRFLKHYGTVSVTAGLR
jgi:NAD(P)-dependent dehydrogenase (short-subunit alcohol dehydrogenase family)